VGGGVVFSLKLYTFQENRSRVWRRREREEKRAKMMMATASSFLIFFLSMSIPLITAISPCGEERGKKRGGGE